MGKHDMLISMFNFLSMGRFIGYFASLALNAFLIASGSDCRHSWYVVPGKVSASFSASGLEIGCILARIWLKYVAFNPSSSAICICVIVAMV